MFFTDVIINCFSSYYRSDGEMEMRFTAVILKYARTWMLLDIVASIPTSLIETVMNPG